jgi:antirestriction protein
MRVAYSRNQLGLAKIVTGLSDRFPFVCSHIQYACSLAYYIDYEAMARDLSLEYSETTISGKRLIYACR